MTDINQIIENLLNFYDFKNKKIISVGAGGGQFVEYARQALHVIAIDNDNVALSKLNDSLQKSGLINKFTLIHSDFIQLYQKADVVMFEFCLHEMINPELAINHAITMAPCVLITDHSSDSEWAYIVDEREKVQKSWNTLNKFNIVQQKHFNTVQFFHNYDELFQKVQIQGKNTINRIEKFKNANDFTIPMRYNFTLITI